MQRILIVEDEQTLAFALQEALIDEGYDVSTASDGQEAMQMLRTKPCNVVVTDLKMPGISGIQLLKLIKEATPSTQVIIVTAYGSLETAIDALRLHAFDFIMKPYPVDRLKSSVKEAMEISKSERIGETMPAQRPVHGRMLGTEKISVSWDNDPVEEITYSLDLFNSGGSVNIVFFEINAEILRRRHDILAEVRGFVRNGLFNGRSQHEVIAELKGYSRQAYGIASDLRFFTAIHDDAKEILKMNWEGPHQHIVYSRRNSSAMNLFGHPELHKSRNGHGEYQIRFGGGDSLLLLPSLTADYINQHGGMTQYASVIEKLCREGGADIAEKIRRAISNGSDTAVSGVLAITSKGGIDFNGRLLLKVPSSKSSLTEVKYIAEQVCAKCGCSEEETFEVATALNEALTNSIIHGCQSMRGDIKVLFSSKGSHLNVEVEDKGSGFVYQQASDTEESYEWVMRSKGRGLPIIRRLMDNVSVSSLPGKGTLVKMTKMISSKDK